MANHNSTLLEEIDDFLYEHNCFQFATWEETECFYMKKRGGRCMISIKATKSTAIHMFESLEKAGKDWVFEDHVKDIELFVKSAHCGRHRKGALGRFRKWKKKYHLTLKSEGGKVGNGNKVIDDEDKNDGLSDSEGGSGSDNDGHDASNNSIKSDNDNSSDQDSSHYSQSRSITPLQEAFGTMEIAPEIADTVPKHSNQALSPPSHIESTVEVKITTASTDDVTIDMTKRSTTPETNHNISIHTFASDESLSDTELTVEERVNRVRAHLIDAANALDARVGLDFQEDSELWCILRQLKQLERLKVEKQRSLWAAIEQPATSYDREEGTVYIRRHTSRAGVVHIGWTRKSFGEANNTGCYGKETELVWFSPEPLMAAYRVKKLAVAELASHQVEAGEVHCGDSMCTKQHREWYRISETQGRDVLENWTRFVQLAGFGVSGSLSKPGRIIMDRIYEDVGINSTVGSGVEDIDKPRIPTTFAEILPADDRLQIRDLVIEEGESGWSRSRRNLKAYIRGRAADILDDLSRAIRQRSTDGVEEGITNDKTERMLNHMLHAFEDPANRHPSSRGSEGTSLLVVQTAAMPTRSVKDLWKRKPRASV